ncbi:hypothetical protein CTEN210_03159 [Chaetoceros tenuissimus]|uniref:Uncharacterized protein n=1 Tax=Chaetoceros tenuissimus TaxID=426638 RepID=A0AAD3H1A8_9STRA|nr:hypothetical protein CTEN210_03159 [Chaetoceros tenuissimus]
MFAKTTVSAVSRVGSRRAMSDAPKLHTAKNSWKTINATRPVDPHPHNVFEPPYNKLTVGLMVVGVVCTGYGSMFYGLSHQQKKQGYWK